MMMMMMTIIIIINNNNNNNNNNVYKMTSCELDMLSEATANVFIYISGKLHFLQVNLLSLLHILLKSLECYILLQTLSCIIQWVVSSLPESFY
jgi:hypothetical protein